jgi:hypothetical protein
MSHQSRDEQLSLDSLKAVFINTKVEGDSGYSKLMKIKAAYLKQGVLPRLMQDVDAACRPFEESFARSYATISTTSSIANSARAALFTSVTRRPARLPGRVRGLSQEAEEQVGILTPFLGQRA